VSTWSGWECKQCEKIVGELQQEVIAINSSYTAKIQDFFNTQICPQMPAPSQKTCLDFANTKLVELWSEAIDDVLDPEEACTKMLRGFPRGWLFFSGTFSCGCPSWATGVPLFTTWDSVAGLGSPMPGNNSDRSRPGQ
jgi:hypothetical protein